MTLLWNVLDLFWDSCRIYSEHKEHEPKGPEEKMGNRIYWELNHSHNEVNLNAAAGLLSQSEFSDPEKAEIATRLTLLAIHHKGDTAIMGHIGLILQVNNLPATVNIG